MVRSESASLTPADRRRQVLRLHRPHHVGDRDAGGVEPLRLELDRQLALDLALQAHVGDAGDAAQLLDHLGVGDGG